MGRLTLEERTQSRSKQSNGIRKVKVVNHRVKLRDHSTNHQSLNSLAEEYYKEHDGAFIGQWGEKEFLKQQNRGKKFGIFFLVLGSILSIFG